MATGREIVGWIASWLDLGWRGLLTAWSWAIFGSGVIVWSILVLPLMAGLAFLMPALRNRVTDATQAAVGLFVRLLPFIRVEVDRARRLPSGCRVVVVNHQSFIDPLIIFAVEKRVRGPARGYLFRTPFLRTYLRFAGFYLSDRGDPAPLQKMRLAAEEVLASDGCLLFYPEGTRSRTGEMGEFGLGAFRIAHEFEMPIQPIIVEGLDRAYPSGTVVVKTRWRYPVKVRYLDPILPSFEEGTPRRVVRALGQQVRVAMDAELQRMRSERPSGGPDSP